VASRARGRALVAVAVLAAVASATFPVVNPAPGEVVTIGLPGFLFTVIAFGWGLYLRTRHELAERLAGDRRQALEQAREAERRRIAREMHDVLAHRLSLLSVHAGALEFRPDATPGEIAQAAGVVRTSAAAALADLRQVITVLREDAGAGPPQPGFGQLNELLAESRSAGMTLRAHLDADASLLPAELGRTIYRIVQEGLTNARKHAPGATVTVAVRVTGETVSAEVSNPLTAGPAGAGAGLTGLAERVTLAGGELEHGPDGAGRFALRAVIPL